MIKYNKNTVYYKIINPTIFHSNVNYLCVCVFLVENSVYFWILFVASVILIGQSTLEIASKYRTTIALQCLNVLQVTLAIDICLTEF